MARCSVLAMAYILIAHSTIIFGSAMVSVLYFFAHFDGILDCYSEHGATTPGAARREFLPMVLYLLALPASVIFLAHGLLGGVINACGVDAAISAELSRQSDRGSGRTPRYTVERSQRRYELNTRAGILLKWGDRLLAFGLACAFISFVQCVLPRKFGAAQFCGGKLARCTSARFPLTRPAPILAGTSCSASSSSATAASLCSGSSRRPPTTRPHR